MHFIFIFLFDEESFFLEYFKESSPKSTVGQSGFREFELRRVQSLLIKVRNLWVRRSEKDILEVHFFRAVVFLLKVA